MPVMDKRTFLKIAAAGSAGAGSLSWLMQNAIAADKPAQASMPKDFYSVPKKGQARILHTTDVHGQLLPVYFREPNVNLGVGPALGRPPHIVGKKLLEKMDLPLDGPEAYAYTYLDFFNAAKKYGKTGGYSHMKTLLDMLRKE
ncbi:MAG: thiosulfohydrolase SoxB, partial [Cocleimonas sp.]